MRSIIIINGSSGSYEPIAAVPVARAINLILSGKAVSVRDSSVLFSSENLRIPVPAVIRMAYGVERGRGFTRYSLYRYSKQGILVRDDYTCVYCYKYGNTIDHVVPRAMGGLSSYENCVAACRACNEEKADSTLDEMGWELPFSPTVPSRNVISSLQEESSASHRNRLEESLQLAMAG